ncbi:hypothetical protein KIH31_02385 [Paenarthrobacter sp. DKR-5]|uniref:biotin carboxylase N-terminal domain-containing protein n=1 Tax=Paenarthrobacter sp. DKR-5 TaxID=2835535 RepID=UPI001BDCA297|nr:biotin carboxylase N-terminal domain-containing protein [Paenarthrobacter sp. DKR-5]MBT1001439.1 hypothetical protein [Paenarthrobacter sp. DKR-5]
MRTVLVADHGTAAVRIIRACRARGLWTVAVYSDADADAPHVLAADEAFALGGPAAQNAYLDRRRLLAVLRLSGADAVHPGTSGLAADPLFAAAVTRGGRVWIGDPSGRRPLQEDTAPLDDACSPDSPAPLAVQVQLAADRTGAITSLGTRNVSLQRRGAVLAAEAPAALGTTAGARLLDLATGAARGLTGLATVEAQVHWDRIVLTGVRPGLDPVFALTEAAAGVDLVGLQLDLAGGALLEAALPEPAHRHAFLFDIFAEDAGRGFLPAAGTVESIEGADEEAVTWAVQAGSPVVLSRPGPVAQLVTAAGSRGAALASARRALTGVRLAGVATLLPFFRALAADGAFSAAPADTRWLQETTLPVLPDPAYSDVEPDTGRRRLTVELDGRTVTLGLPAALLGSWAHG